MFIIGIILNILIILDSECTVDGIAGDGASQGTCSPGGLCQSDGQCNGRFPVFIAVFSVRNNETRVKLYMFSSKSLNI